MRIENEQIKLGLTFDPEVLAWLRRTGALVKCKAPAGVKTLKGWERYELQFDTQPIDFLVNEKTSERTIHPFGADVAKGLMRSSLTVVGDPNSAPIRAVEEISRFQLQTGDPVARDPNSCPYCGAGADSKGNPFTPTKLAYHINRECTGWKREGGLEEEDEAPAADAGDESEEAVSVAAGDPDGDDSAQ